MTLSLIPRAALHFRCTSTYTPRGHSLIKWLLLFSRVQIFVTPWTVAHQAPLSMGFPRQEYWSGLSFPSPGDLPDPGIEPMSPAWAGRFFTPEPPEKPLGTLKSHCPFTVVTMSVKTPNTGSAALLLVKPHYGKSQHTKHSSRNFWTILLGDLCMYFHHNTSNITVSIVCSPPWRVKALRTGPRALTSIIYYSAQSMALGRQSTQICSMNQSIHPSI